MNSTLFRGIIVAVVMILGMTHLHQSYATAPKLVIAAEYCCCPDGDCSCTADCCNHEDQRTNGSQKSSSKIFQINKQCQLPGEAQTQFFSTQFLTLISPIVSLTINNDNELLLSNSPQIKYSNSEPLIPPPQHS